MRISNDLYHGQENMPKCPGSSAAEEEEEDVILKKKSSGQKEEIRLLRQEQIQAYRLTVTQEERAKRSKLRQGETRTSADESPKKKKRVSFVPSEGNDSSTCNGDFRCKLREESEAKHKN